MSQKPTPRGSLDRCVKGTRVLGATLSVFLFLGVACSGPNKHPPRATDEPAGGANGEEAPEVQPPNGGPLAGNAPPTGNPGSGGSAAAPAPAPLGGAPLGLGGTPF